MGIENSPESQTLHTATVEGIIRVIKFYADATEGVSMGELCKVGTIHTDDEDVETYIIEFIKDGLINLKTETIQAIQNGDYASIWTMINRYLQRLGHTPQEPIEINI